MKKVWILERFADADKMVECYGQMKAIFENAKGSEMTEEQIAQIEQAVIAYENKMKENPNGRWYGFEGNVRYNDFCYIAKAAISRNPNSKFRVVEGEIPEDSKSWVDYKFVKVNDGVFRYLMATK